VATDSAEHRARVAEYHSRFAAAAFGWTLFRVGRTQSIDYELPACCGWSLRTGVYCTLPGAQMNLFLALFLAFVRGLRFSRVRALKLKSDVLGMVMDGVNRYAKELRNSGLRQFGIEQSFNLAFSSREFGTGQSVKPWHISMRTDRRVALGGPFNAIFATQRTMTLGTFAARCFTTIRDVLAVFAESHSLSPARIRQRAKMFDPFIGLVEGHIAQYASERARRQGPGVPVPSGKRQNTIIALGVFNGG
jgi:hypothetical protein